MEKPGSAIMTVPLGIQLTIAVLAARNCCGQRVATACSTASPLSKKISTTRTYACVEVAVPVVVVPVSDLVRENIGETGQVTWYGPVFTGEKGSAPVASPVAEDLAHPLET